MVATSCQVFYSNISKKPQPALKQVPQPRSVEDFAYAVLVYGRKVDDILAWSQALREVPALQIGPRLSSSGDSIALLPLLPSRSQNF